LNNLQIEEMRNMKRVPFTKILLPILLPFGGAQEELQHS